MSNSTNFTPGVKIWAFKSNRKNKDFPQSKNLQESLDLRHFGNGGNFWGLKSRGKNFSTYEIVSICKHIVFLKFLGLGIKYSRWGKKLPSGVKTY